MSLFISISCVLLIALLGYVYVKRKYSYWADRGVPFLPPKFPGGNMDGVGKTITVGELMQKFYFELKGKGPVGGIYFLTKPSAVITDLELLKHVFVKDFEYFQDRGIYFNERDDPLSAHLFALEGAQWKSLRSKLSPTFTSGKMKMMHSTLVMVAAQFIDHLKVLTDGQNKELEFKDLFSQLTMDIIGNVAFGIECNTMKDPNSEFTRIGRKIFEPNSSLIILGILTTMFPKLSRYLRVKINDPVVTEFFLKLLTDTIKYREENNIQRNDFLSLLIQIKNTGKLDGEDADLGTLTFNELAAQVFLFFVAGFETSASALMFAFYELALDADVQERAREEVREVLKRHNGQLSYEAAMELHYIDQIIKETLRKYPVADTHVRTTAKAYKVPSTNIVLEKGTGIVIPVMGFHYDPDIYPIPDKFDPERFTKEQIASRHAFSWMPFGDGPRSCIGIRFAMMQMRLCIAMTLINFKVSPSEKTLIPMKFQPDIQSISPLGGMFLNIEMLNKEE